MLKKRLVLSLATACALFLAAVPALADIGDALPPWPDDAIFGVVVLQDLSGIGKGAAACLPDIPDTELAKKWLDAVPARSLALSFGMVGNEFRLRGALSFPESKRELLKLIAEGKAEPKDFDALFDNPAPGLFEYVPDGDSYYILQEGVALAGFAVKDDMLLLGFSPEDIAAVRDALADPEKRIRLERKSDAKDYAFFHDNGLLLAELQKSWGVLPKENQPKMRFELSYIPTDTGWKIFGSSNAASLVFDEAALAALKPLEPGSLELYGDTAPFFASASGLLLPDTFFSALKTAAASGDEGAVAITAGLDALAPYGIDEATVRGLLGSFTLVAGGKSEGASALADGITIPSFYAVLRGAPDAVAKAQAAFEKFLGEEGIREELPFENPAIDGWGKVFAFNAPVPAVVAFRENALVLGLLDAASLAKKPAVPPALAELEKGTYYKYGWTDASAVAAWLFTFFDPVAQPWHEEAGIWNMKEGAPVIIPMLRSLAGLGDITSTVANFEDFVMEGRRREPDKALADRMAAVITEWQAYTPPPPPEEASTEAESEDVLLSEDVVPTP